MQPILLFVSISFALVFSQSNTWRITPVTGQDSLCRQGGALTFLPDSNRFLVSMGVLNRSTPPYSEQVMSLRDSLWKNHFPAGKLGVWGDTTGPADSVIYSAFFAIGLRNGIVRPNLDHWSSQAYAQHAYCPDDGKVYYYILNRTFSYDPNARIWAVLDTLNGPAGAVYTSKINWGAMAWDPINHEMVFFGGGCVNRKNGHPGTWTYKPTTNTWTRLALSPEPAPRGNSPLCYDAKNKCMVLFSGDHADYLHGDTWIYDCSTRLWVRKHPAVSPYPRAGHALLYLSKSQKVVMFGGYTHHYDVTEVVRDSREYAPIDTVELWAYDPADGAEGSWKMIRRLSGPEPVCVGNGGRVYQLAAAADSSNRIVAVGDLPGTGNTGFDPVTYVMDCDPSVTDAANTAKYGWPTDSNRVRIKRYDPAYFRQDEATVDSAANEAFLRNLTPNVLTYIAQPRLPRGGRDYGKAAIATDRGVIFHWGGGHATTCGNDVPEYHIAKNRWYIGYAPETPFEHTGSNAGGPNAPVTFGNRPWMVTHGYDCYDYCPVLKKLLLWHHYYTHVYDPVRMDWDTTWIPDHPTMTADVYHRSLQSSPHGMVAWGSKGYANGLWMLDTTTLTWQPVPIKNSEAVPGYYCEQGASVYDSKRDRMLVGNVTRPAGTWVCSGQVWEYRFADSTLNKLNPADTALVYGVYRVRDAVYIKSADQVLFQETVSVGGVPGIMTYDCAANRWKCAPVTTTGAKLMPWQASSNSRPFLYDEKRDIVFAVNAGNDLWAMKYRDQTLAFEAAERAGSAIPSLSVAPNPSGAMVAIRFNGKAGAGSRLTIYNLAGQCVREFHGLAGKSVAWDGRDGFGREMASGIYLAEYRTGAKLLKARFLRLR